MQSINFKLWTLEEREVQVYKARVFTTNEHLPRTALRLYKYQNLSRLAIMSTQATAKTLFLKVNQTSHAYRLVGKATSSPPLLMLNHVRSTIDTWDPLVIDALATSRQLITYDYAGLGHSSGAVARNIRAFASDLLAFLRALLPSLNSTTIDVLGFSLGGYVAQYLALLAPDLINKLVLSGTGPSLGPGLSRPSK